MSTQEIADRLARGRERQAARKAYLIGRQRCYRCGTQDAYTINGRTRCAECVEKGRLQTEKHRPEHKEQVKASQKALYYARKNAGLCPQCGRPRDGATVYCKTCAARRRENWRKNYVNPMLHCRRCDNMPEPGYSYCKECLEKVREERRRWWASVKCTAASRGENSPDESSDQGKGSSSRSDDPQETV